MTDQIYTGWRKASRSDEGNCVEVAEAHDGRTVAVRDSKDADGPMLEFSRSGWQTFIDDVRNGEFDLP
jgi:hypothetical protein